MSARIAIEAELGRRSYDGWWIRPDGRVFKLGSHEQHGTARCVGEVDDPEGAGWARVLLLSELYSSEPPDLLVDAKSLTQSQRRAVLRIASERGVTPVQVGVGSARRIIESDPSGRPTWWIDAGGKLHDIDYQSHGAWAQELLDQPIAPEGQEDAFNEAALDEMWAKGWRRVVQEGRTIYVNGKDGDGRVTRAQREALEFLAAERGCDLRDREGNVLWSPVQESFAYSADGRDDPFKLGDSYWMTPDGRLLDIWNTEHNEWAKHHLGKGRDRLLASGWLRMVSVAPMALPGYEDRRLISVSGGKMPNRAQRAALERAAIKSGAELQADVGDRPAVVLYAPPVLESFADVAELAGKEIKGGEWVAFADDSGSLGIPRSEMPQVKAEHRGALTQFLKGLGIESEEDEVEPGKLKPTQKEWSPEKVEGAREHKGGDRAILVAKDNFIVDGHHQWLARLWDKAGEPMRVIRYGAKIREVLKAMAEFPSVEQAAGATKVKESAARYAVEAMSFAEQEGYWLEPSGKIHHIGDDTHLEWARDNKEAEVEDLIALGWIRVVTADNPRTIYAAGKSLNRAQRSALETEAIRREAKLVWDKAGYAEDRANDVNRFVTLYEPPKQESAPCRVIESEEATGGDKFRMGDDYWIEPGGELHALDPHQTHDQWAMERFPGEERDSLIRSRWRRVVSIVEPGRRVVYTSGGPLSREQRRVLETVAIKGSAWLIRDTAAPAKDGGVGGETVLYQPPVQEALRVRVPPFAQGSFFQDHGAPEEFWAFKSRPAAKPGDAIEFAFGSKPVAKAVVSRLEAPGKSACGHSGKFGGKWKVHWKDASFKRVNESVINPKAVADWLHWQDSYGGLYPGYPNNRKEGECMYDSEEKFLELVNEVSDFINGLPQVIPVYRAVSVQSPAEVDLDFPGDHWSVEARAAYEFGRHNGSRFAIVGAVDKRYVNVFRTAEAYVEFSAGMSADAEWEVVIEDSGRPVERKRVVPLKALLTCLSESLGWRTPVVGVVSADGDVQFRQSMASHRELGLGRGCAWRYSPATRKVYWWDLDDATPERRAEVEDALDRATNVDGEGFAVAGHAEVLPREDDNFDNWEAAHGPGRRA